MTSGLHTLAMLPLSRVSAFRTLSLRTQSLYRLQKIRFRYYNRAQNKRATPINPAGALFIATSFAFVDCATVELAVREGLVTFDDGKA